MFCAAIPAAAAAGAALHNKQAHRPRQAIETGRSGAAPKPILRITAAVIALLIAGSITNHTLRIGL
jgi:hypothetical protein